MLIPYSPHTIWKTILCDFAIKLGVFFSQAEQDDSVEFNIHMLDAEDRDNVDLSRFSTLKLYHSGYVLFRYSSKWSRLSSPKY